MSAQYDARRAWMIRVTAWALLPLLAAGDALVLSLNPPAAVGSLVSYVLTYFVPMFLMIAAALALGLHLKGVERRFWTLLGLALLSVSISEVYWIFYELTVDYRGPTIPNWGEAGHLSGMLIFYLLVVSMTEFGHAPLFTRLRFYLDVLGGLLVAYATFYWFWTLPLFLHLRNGGWVVGAIIGLYPVLGLVMLATAGLLVNGWRVTRWRSWERLVVLFFVSYGFAVLASPYLNAAWIASPVFSVTDPYTMFLGLGLFVLFMAAVYRFTEPPGSSRAEPWPVAQLKPEWLPMLYPSLIALAMLAIGLGTLRTAGRAGSNVLVLVVGLLVVILILRSWVSSVELAHHKARTITDPLTGAFNQRHLYDRLPREIAEAGVAQRPLAIVAFDVVDFRNMVRMSGVEAGERVLTELCETLRAEVSTGGAVYRVGRDEFLVTCVGFTEQDAIDLARRVNTQVTRHISVDGVPLALSAGAAIFPDHGADAATLVSRAFASQELARSAERTDIVVFERGVVDAADPLARLEGSRRRSHRAKLRALAAAVDSRDADTRFHSQVVGEIASAFALVLELSDAQTQVLEAAAPVHDLGKIGVPDEILLKVGRLSAAERKIIEQHPALSERLLVPADMPEVLAAVRHHHERWDGFGYPDGLSGKGIPLEARVLTICDAFEAMTSTRRYRPSLTTAQALQEIERCSGTQFDPELVVVFSRMVVALHGRALSARIEHTRRELGLEPT